MLILIEYISLSIPKNLYLSETAVNLNLIMVASTETCTWRVVSIHILLGLEVPSTTA